MAQALNALIPAGVQAPEIGNALAGGIEAGNALAMAPYKRKLLEAQAENGGLGLGVYGTPIYGQDEQGNTTLGVIGKDGSYRPVNTGGVTPTPGVAFQNTGTSFVPVDRRTGRQAAPSIPIDNAGAARDTEVGKEQGANVALLSSMESKLPGLYQTVEKLGGLSDKATYTAAGQFVDWGRKQLGMDPSDGAVARADYIATIDNEVLPLLRDTFGAAFTVEEGNRLRATLGDPDMSPAEKKVTLRAFIDNKVNTIKALQANVGGASGGGGLSEGQTVYDPQGRPHIVQGGQLVPVGQ